MKRFTDNYLAVALATGFLLSALWALFRLLGDGASEPDQMLYTSMGMIVGMLAPFLLVVFLSGLLAGRDQVTGDQQINIFRYPLQRQRFGFTLMTAALTAFVVSLLAAETIVFIIIGSTVLLLGGLVLVYSSL